MNDVTIIRSSDAAELLAWRMEVLHEVFALPAEADTAALEAANRDYYERSLAAGSHVACLATAEGRAVGCGGVCFYEEMPSPDNPNGRCAYLMNIYVRAPFRGRGFARRIVRWLVGQALARGVSKIYLETTTAGRSLYAGLGFRDMKDMMKLENDINTRF